MHDLALSPSTWTVQAPQLLVSQPTWVPVRPRSSRRKWTRRRRGSTSASWASPLTVTEMCWVVIVVLASYAYARARSTAVRRARSGQLGDHRPLVFDRTADVAAGPALRAGGRAGLAEEVVAGALPDEDGLGVGRRERGLGDAGDADAGALDAAVGAEADHRPPTPAVAKSPTLRSSFW